MVAPVTCSELGCNGCVAPCANHPRLGGLGALGLSFSIPTAVQGATQAARAGVKAVTPTPNWWTSTLQTVGEFARGATEVAKVAVPAYMGLQNLKQQVKAIKYQTQAGQSAAPFIQQTAGQGLALVPAIGQELQELSTELLKLKAARAAAQKPGWLETVFGSPTAGVPGTPAGPPSKGEEESSFMKALPWVAGAAGIGLVVLALVMRR